MMMLSESLVSSSPHDDAARLLSPRLALKHVYRYWMSTGLEHDAASSQLAFLLFPPFSPEEVTWPCSIVIPVSIWKSQPQRFASWMRAVKSIGRGWCDEFAIRHAV